MVLRFRAALLVAPLLLFSPALSHAAAIYLDPQSGTFGPGDTFILTARLQIDDECINAAEVEVSYPTRSLRAVDFGKGGSILSLWIEEPRIDVERGVVTFSGGIPGGYCGRIQGDPGLSNTLGKIVFTVTDPSEKTASIKVSPRSEIFLNDGLGTRIMPTTSGAAITLSDTAQLSENPWLAEVRSDETSPEPFEVQVQSTREVFNGRYYLVFSTVDKQSGIDHYELLARGGWKTVSSPYDLKDQSLLSDLKLKAIDKAGNERLGSYNASAVPPRQYSVGDFTSLFVILGIIVSAIIAKMVLDRRGRRDPTTVIDPPSSPQV